MNEKFFAAVGVGALACAGAEATGWLMSMSNPNSPFGEGPYLITNYIGPLLDISLFSRFVSQETAVTMAIVLPSAFSMAVGAITGSYYTYNNRRQTPSSSPSARI
ncbi:MAG: hypothetical protein AAF988_07875 [Pseudomonadota bacterium]